jgi:hypothetical protein
MTAKHFSEYQKRFLCRSNPYKPCYLENSIFGILGHSDRKTRFWNFDPQNRPLKIAKPPSGQKSKNRFFSANFRSIVAYEYSKVAHGHFWQLPAWIRLKTGFANFLQPKYVFSTIFEPKTSIFKSTKWCQSVQKSWFSPNRVYTHFPV